MPSIQVGSLSLPPHIQEGRKGRDEGRKGGKEGGRKALALTPKIEHWGKKSNQIPMGHNLKRENLFGIVIKGIQSIMVGKVSWRRSSSLEDAQSGIAVQAKAPTLSVSAPVTLLLQ